MRRVILCAAAALALAPAASRAQLIEDYRFKGSVVDSSGKPIPEVEVTLREPSTGQRITFRTEADGTFDRRMVPKGVYQATFEKPGFEPFRETFDWSAAAPTTVVKEMTIWLTSQEERAKAEQARAQAELGKKTGKLYEKAYAALTAGDCAEAQKNAREILAIGAGSVEYAVRFVLARCQAMANAHEAAIAEYRTVIGLKPDLFEAHFDLAGVLERSGKHAEALAEYERAAELKPSDLDVQYNMGAILFREGRYDQARPHLEAVVAGNPGHAQSHKALGFVFLSSDKKDMARAGQHLKRYLELEPQAADGEQVRTILRELGVK